ncbi:glycosyltransferase family 39 protein [Candidatus Woesearchaeota archaeon]|nr:glycosyltransferase family 39 protein [Candidatus Woesearchaeota archaeon]
MISVSKQKLLLLIIAVFIIAKTLIALSFHPAQWDEAVYVGMGKYIYSSGQSGFWEPIRPPVLPLLIGLLNPFTAEMLMTAFAAGTILLTYIIAAKLFNERAAILSALLVAGSTIFFKQSSLFMTEIPSTLLALATLYFLITQRLTSASATSGLAALTKFPHFLLIIILLLPLLQLLQQKKLKIAAAKTAVPFATIILIYLTINFFSYGQNIRAALEPLILAASHQSNPIEAVHGLLYNAFFYLIVLVKQNLFFIFLPLGVIAAVRTKKYLLLSYLATYLLYFTLIINKQERFALLFLPAAAILAGQGVYQLLLTKTGNRTGMAATALLFLAAGFVTFNITAENYGYYHERQQAAAPEYSYSGTILTSNPTVAYYTNNKVIPYYFSTADGEEGIRKAAERFEKNKDSSEIYFNANDFYCEKYDRYCSEALEKIENST